MSAPKRPHLASQRKPPPPLDSQDWLPFDDALDQLCQRRSASDQDLALEDLNKTIRTIPTKRREVGGNPDGERLKLAFWDNHEPWLTSSGVVVIDTKKQFDPKARFYLWRPDFEEMWGEVARQPERAASVDGPALRGRRRAKEWPTIVGEIAFQVYVQSREPSKRFTDDMVNWCKSKGITPPNRRDLARHIDGIYDRKPPKR
jgi:hypothetical protein